MAHFNFQPQKRTTVSVFARRTLLVGLLAVATAGTLAGCETQAPYAACQLDEEVTSKGVCQGDSTDGTGTTSCVVTSHPHCVQSICLSYYSAASVCTHACSADADCELDGWCWAFSPTQKYCVPIERKNTTAG
jgi:hypothetical protein